VVSFLIDSINVEKLSFSRSMELLHALSMGDFADIGKGKALMKQLVSKIDALDFSQTSNELNFTEFETLYDIYVSSPIQFKNKGLLNALSSRIARLV